MSMALIRAWASGLRTKLACSSPGQAMSSMKRPRPRRRLASSSRAMARPIHGPAASSLVSPRPAVTRLLPLHLLHDRVPLRELLPQVLVGPCRPEAQHRLEAGFDELLLEFLVGPFLLGGGVDLLEHGGRRGD